MGRDVGSGVDSLSRTPGGRARPADAAHVRADAARCDPACVWITGRRWVGARAATGPDLPLRRLGRRARDHGRPPLPPGDELGRVPDEWWGAFAIWKGGLGVWGGIGLGVIAGYVMPGAQAPTRRCSPTALPPGCSSRRASVVSATGGTRSSSGANRPAVGARRSSREPSAALPRRPDLPPDLPLRGTLELRRRGRTDPDRAPVQDPAAGAFRAVRHRLLLRPLLDELLQSTQPMSSPACA